MYTKLGFNEDVVNYAISKEKEIKNLFEDIDEIAEYNQIKVLNAMKLAKLADSDFLVSTGYGYSDITRDKLEMIYANVFESEAALVRPNLISGTHALSVALFGLLRPNDELLSPAGALYDTMQEVIGIRNSTGSLKEYGINYSQVDLKGDEFDYAQIKEKISDRTKVIIIQRSKGYSTRKSFTIEKISELISFIKNIKKDIIVLVDNCYGEFVEKLEPTQVGADVIVGSLIKNPGGGLAPIGGYIVGKEELIEKISYRLSAPGLGREVGASLGISKMMLQGLFLAPSVVASALKTAIFAAKLYQDLGYEVIPGFDEKRTDIIQSIVLSSEEKILSFCKGIQSASPVDSFVTPIGGEMPGYESNVVMAAGAFTQGSSIELSADAPIREPYAVYFQGGLTYLHGKYGIISSLNEVGLVRVDKK